MNDAMTYILIAAFAIIAAGLVWRGLTKAKAAEPEVLRAALVAGWHEYDRVLAAKETAAQAELAAVATEKAAGAKLKAMLAA